MLPVFLSVFVGFLVFWIAGFAAPWFFRALRPALRKLQPAVAADLLFLLELFPCAAACVAVVLFVLPGFAMWEPRHSEEGIPWFVLSVSTFGLVVFGRSIVLALRDLRKARELASQSATIAVVGCVRPTIVVSAQASDLLDEEELRCVLDHEDAHVQRQDNLRLFLSRVWERLTPAASRLGELRAERLRQTELAADESAATSMHTALQLASALVKVAHSCPAAGGMLASSFATTHSTFLLNDRVQRLLNRGPEAQSKKELVFDALALTTIAAAVLALASDARVQHTCYLLLEKIVSG